MRIVEEEAEEEEEEEEEEEDCGGTEGGTTGVRCKPYSPLPKGGGKLLG